MSVRAEIVQFPRPEWEPTVRACASELLEALDREAEPCLEAPERLRRRLLTTEKAGALRLALGLALRGRP